MQLASLEYAKPLQIQSELTRLVELIVSEGVRSYLEVGVRYGGSFETIMSALPPRSMGCAVDFPGGNFGDENSVPIFLESVKRLRAKDYSVNYVFGPSGSEDVISRARQFAPYDALLIDGDHSYQAVKEDFNNYADMARIVILHDIAAPHDVRSKTGKPVEVPAFWQEIKQSYHHTEIIEPGSDMGIGVIFR